MREDQKIKQHGKDYVLFGGLVAEAHEMFVTWQLEADLNEQLYLANPEQPLVKAFFQGTYYDEEGERQHISTTGIGTGGRQTDTKGAPADAPVEMAETRAKARALRIAVNIAETAFEELPSQEEEGSAASNVSGAVRRTASPVTQRANQPKQKTPHSEGQITDDTLKKLRFVAKIYAKAVDKDVEEHIEAFQHNEGAMDQMSEGEGLRWIGRYESALEKLGNEAEAEEQAARG